MPITNASSPVSFEEIVKKFAIEPDVRIEHPGLTRSSVIPIGGKRMDSVPEGNRLYLRLNEVALLGHFENFIDRKNEIVLCAVVIDSNAAEPITFHTPAFPGIKKGDKLPLGDNGLGLYMAMPAKLPEFVCLNLLIVEDDQDIRGVGATLAKLLELEEYKTLLATVQELVSAGNPIYGQLVKAGAAVIGLFAKLLEANKDDRVAYFAATHTRAFDDLGIGKHSFFQAKTASVKYEILTTTAPALPPL